jgi:hypothetical protein
MFLFFTREVSPMPTYLTLAYEGNYAGSYICPDKSRIEFFTYQCETYLAIPQTDEVYPISKTFVGC